MIVELTMLCYITLHHKALHKRKFSSGFMEFNGIDCANIFLEIENRDRFNASRLRFKSSISVSLDIACVEKASSYVNL